MNRVISIAIVTALIPVTAQTVLADHGENFHCDRMPFLSEPAKDAMSKLAHNNGMKKIISFYAWEWENEEMKRICDAGTSGESVDTSCLEGKRDWFAIAQKVPDDLFGKSNKELRPHMLKLSEQGINTTDRRKTMQYCANLGVVDSAFK